MTVTSARPSEGSLEEPENITSSIFEPRMLLGPCTPMTQVIASTMLDLPDPFGPIMAEIPEVKSTDANREKDLKPLSSNLVIFKLSLPLRSQVYSGKASLEAI